MNKISIQVAVSLIVCFANSNSQPINLTSQMQSLQVIADFQVNENAGGSASQYTPKVVDVANGGFVVVWVDYRNGDADIYGQRFAADDTPLAEAFRANDDSSVAYQYHESIAADASGSFVIVWADERDDEENDIYAQRYGSDGTALGSNFKVNDDATGFSQVEPDVAMDADGVFFVVWEDMRNSVRDIYAQRYSSNGQPLGANFKINQGPSNSSAYSPSIAADSSGTFIIAWYDYRDNKTRIFARRFQSDGAPFSDEFLVNDDSGSARHFSPSVASNANGNLIIAWHDEREGNRNIYAQRYASDGSLLGNNFKVNDSSSGNSPRYAAAAVDSAGSFVITWMAAVGSDYNIYAQRFANDGSALGSNFLVNDDQTNLYQSNPAVAASNNGDFIIAWGDRRQVYSAAYAQRYANDGNPSGANFMINFNEGSAGQERSRIATAGNGNFVVTWMDRRNGINEVYAKLFATDGSPLTGDFKVNDDAGIAHHSYPALAVHENGDFVIAWTDTRDSGINIYAQLFTSNGTPQGNNFKVNDDVGDAFFCSVSVLPDSRFMIVWQDKRNGNDDIYAQRYDADGTPLGINFRVNDDPGTAEQADPAVCADNSVNFWVVWQDKRNGNYYDIYAQAFSGDGAALGANMKLDDENPNMHQFNPAVAAFGNGNFIAVWEDMRDDNSDIYGQRYYANGLNPGGNFKVNDDTLGFDHYAPAVSSDENGNVIILWVDDRNGTDDIWGQKYASDDSAFGDNFLVTNASVKLQRYPDVALRNNQIYSTWTDNRAPGTSFDIWANVQEWGEATGVEERQFSREPFDFVLEQNHPNPFNPSTTISYQLPQQSNVELAIYNMAGQKIATVVSERQLAGSYQYEWDAGGLASGVYFYRITAGEFVRVKKLLLLK